MPPIRVLVTGAGSGVGQGIVKSLRISSVPVTVISSDITILNSALFRTDEGILLPKVEDSGSLEKIIAGIKQHDIHIVMIGSEFDLGFFAQHKTTIEKETGASVIVSPVETVTIADDKWRTAEFLRENGLPHVDSYLPHDEADAITKAGSWGFPLVLKTRRGTSSRHVHVIENAASLLHFYATVPNPMLQKMIVRPSTELGLEYTCSIFRCADGTVLGPFTARRTLRGGSSWCIEVAPFENLYPLILGIGRHLPVLGSLNVQLMVGPQGPVPFEFNARFSGTTAVRAHFGFNEPEMALKSYFLGETIPSPQVRKGLAFRYLEEVFVDDVSVAELSVPPPKGHVRPWF